MDSLTQGLLGAATFAVVTDKEIGKKSFWIGAVAGTIPVLDEFISPLFHEIEFFSVQRGVSHCEGFTVILSVILAELFYKIYKKEQSGMGWIFAFFLALMPHTLLDWCTTYGTKLLSPFRSHLFSTNNIHVFEPTYSLILLTGVILLEVGKPSKAKRQKILNLSLIISTTFLLWTSISKELQIKNLLLN